MNIANLLSAIAANLVLLGVVGTAVLGGQVAVRVFDWLRALFFDHNPDWAYRHGWSDGDDGTWWKNDGED